MRIKEETTTSKKALQAILISLPLSIASFLIYYFIAYHFVIITEPYKKLFECLIFGLPFITILLVIWYLVNILILPIHRSLSLISVIILFNYFSAPDFEAKEICRNLNLNPLQTYVFKSSNENLIAAIKRIKTSQKTQESIDTKQDAYKEKRLKELNEIFLKIQ